MFDTLLVKLGLKRTALLVCRIRQGTPRPVHGTAKDGLGVPDSAGGSQLQRHTIHYYTNHAALIEWLH